MGAGCFFENSVFILKPMFWRAAQNSAKMRAGARASASKRSQGGVCFFEVDGFLCEVSVFYSGVDVLEGCTKQRKNARWRARFARPPARIFEWFCAALQNIGFRIKTETSKKKQTLQKINAPQLGVRYSTSG